MDGFGDNEDRFDGGQYTTCFLATFDFIIAHPTAILKPSLRLTLLLLFWLASLRED